MPQRPSADPSSAPPRTPEGPAAVDLDDETRLLERLRARDEQAFSALINRYHGAMLRVALAFVPSQAVAEEVVQEAWVGVLTGIHRFEGRSSLKTWIFRILTNRAKTRGVREGRTVPFSSMAGAEEGAGPAVDAARFNSDGMWGLPPRPWQEVSSEQRLVQTRAIAGLQQALETLPPAQRAVVTLRDVEGLDAAEVCNMLEISETNQRVLLHRGRSKLRSVLEAHLGRE